MDESCPNSSHNRIWGSHSLQMNESCPTYERVMSHIYMRPWVMSQLSPQSHMRESFLTKEWVMSHTWMSHVPYMYQFLSHVPTLPTIGSTGWRTPKRCLVFVGRFPQNSPVISGSFAERDPQLKAFYTSSPSSRGLSICALSRTQQICPIVCKYVCGSKFVHGVYLCMCSCMCSCMQKRLGEIEKQS